MESFLSIILEAEDYILIKLINLLGSLFDKNFSYAYFIYCEK